MFYGGTAKEWFPLFDGLFLLFLLLLRVFLPLYIGPDRVLAGFICPDLGGGSDLIAEDLASLITMAACIFLFSIFYAVLANFQSVVQTVESSVAVTVFFDEGTTQEEIDQIGNAIASRDEVLEYTFVSAEEAWEEYKMTYFEGDEEAAAAFGDVNPLANEASYEIYMEDVSMQQELVEYLGGLDHVREVQQSESVANTLTEKEL
ncbi:MAG: permease-like cell division protein FtsX [Clostridiales bacterium]|nr:permease-like cell division protein FtsX [Clostridiales bacterium]